MDKISKDGRRTSDGEEAKERKVAENETTEKWGDFNGRGLFAEFAKKTKVFWGGASIVAE